MAIITDSTVSKAPVEAVEPLRDKHRLWRLHFKRGGNPHCQIAFELDGSIQQAIQRARAYCMKMNYVFIHVEEFLHDLDSDERAFLADS